MVNRASHLDHERAVSSRYQTPFSNSDCTMCDEHHNPLLSTHCQPPSPFQVSSICSLAKDDQGGIHTCGKIEQEIGNQTHN